MIIDAHSHIADEKSYQQYVQKNGGKIDKIITFAFFFQDMKKMYEFTSSKSNLYLVGSIDMDKDLDKQLALCDQLFQEKKIVGIKLYPGYQYFYPSDKRVFPIADLCQKYNRPLIFHSGDFFDVRGYTYKAILKYSNPIHVDELAAQKPGCPIIISHVGFPHMLETALIVYNNPKVYTDISGTIDADSPKEAAFLLEQYEKDLKRIFAYYPGARKKILFGTDFINDETCLSEVLPYIDLIKKIFPAEEQDSVMGNLAQELFFN